MDQLVPSCIISAIALYIAVYLWRVASPMAREARLIEGTPVTPIGRLGAGFYAVKGAVKPLPDQSLTSPLSNLPCVYFRFSVSEQRTTGSGKKRRTSWYSVVSDQGFVPFCLDDGTGEALVNMQEARLFLRPDSRASCSSGVPLPSDLERLLRERYGETCTGSADRRYEETVVRAGDELHVIGCVLMDGARPSFTKGSEFCAVSEMGLAAVLGRSRSMAFWFRLSAAALGVFSVAVPVLALAGVLR